MKRTISLSVPKPCSEKWENFTMTTHGGFCSSCSKTVLDFTTASDDDILQFFKDKPAHACGRFREDQLKTYNFTSSAGTIRPGFTLLKAGLLSLVLLLISKPSSAQNNQEPVRKEITTHDNEKSVSVTGERVIKGIVISAEDKYPLRGVIVLLKGTTLGTITDADGLFEFPQKLKEGDILVFSFIGLSYQEYKVLNESKDKEEIKMFRMRMDITGAVAVTETYTAPPSGFRKMWTKVRGLF